MQAYTRYTYQTSHTLPHQSEDENNLTIHNRALIDYSVAVCPAGENIEHLMQEVLSSGKKITVLDCGAGSGRALDELLKGRFGESIKKCVGLSLHYFKNVAKLFHHHKEKIEWILGPAEKILPELDEKFDLIFDVYGAYYYSAERPLLLDQYHRLLETGGRAKIYPITRKANTIVMENDQSDLELYYIRQYPRDFSINLPPLYPETLHIAKQNEPLSGVKFALLSVEEAGSSLDAEDSPPSSKSDLEKGNAWRPKRVLYTPLY